MAGVGDRRYARPMYGASPMISNAVVSSCRDKSGAVGRFVHRQSSISRMCLSYSRVVRTARLTDADAALPEFPRPVVVTGLSRLPGRGQRVVQDAALIIRQVATVIVSNQVDDRAFRQLGRFVRYESPLFNAGSQWAHTFNVRPPVHCDKRGDAPGLPAITQVPTPRDERRRGQCPKAARNARSKGMCRRRALTAPSTARRLQA